MYEKHRSLYSEDEDKIHAVRAVLFKVVSDIAARLVSGMFDVELDIQNSFTDVNVDLAVTASSAAATSQNLLILEDVLRQFTPTHLLPDTKVSKFKASLTQDFDL